MSYYTSIIVLCWLSLFVLGILVTENNRLTRKEKISFHITYLIVALAALMEWLGVKFNGDMSVPIWALRAVKCVDYIFTPIAGAALITNIQTGKIWKRIIWGILAFNTVFQVISAFTGWMITVDEQNHYSHGVLYPLYIIIYSVMIVFIAIEFIEYGNKFRRQNRISLYAILSLVFICIMIQEFLGNEFRTAYLGITLGMIMMFIHITEFSQLESDETIKEQMYAITTDAMTGVSSRYAYTQALTRLDETKPLPENLTVFSVDIDGLKSVNDCFGHAAGDELICGAAICIIEAFGSNGTCYRTGGDEFIVISEMSREEAEEIMTRLKQNAEDWHGEKVVYLHLSAAFARAADYPELTCEKLVIEADMAMYNEKAAYYHENYVTHRKYSEQNA